MASNHNKNNKNNRTKPRRKPTDYVLAKEGDGKIWGEKCTYFDGHQLYYFQDPSWPSQKLGDLRVVSPPNFDCFFNSLFAFLRLYVTVDSVGVESKPKEKFDQLSSLIREKYPKFIDEDSMDRIINALGIQTMTEVQFQTMYRNKALNRLDLTRPTLLTLKDSDYKDQSNGFGHVGFIAPTKRTKKLTFQQVLGAITGKVFHSCVPMSNMKKKETAVQKLNKAAKQLKDEDWLKRARFYFNLRHIGQDKLPEVTPGQQEQKSWALSLCKAKKLQMGVSWKDFPKTITSKLSEFLVSSFFKSRCPNYWTQVGEFTAKQYRPVLWGYVAQYLSLFLWSKLILGRFLNSRFLAIGVFFLTIFNLMAYGDYVSCVFFCLLPGVFSLANNRRRGIWFLIGGFLCLFGGEKIGSIDLPVWQQVERPNLSSQIDMSAQTSVWNEVRRAVTLINDIGFKHAQFKNRWGNRYADHWLDLFRVQPALHSFSPLELDWIDTMGNYSVVDYLYSLQISRTFWDVILWRKEIDQDPLVEIRRLLFVEKYDHRIEDQWCDHGLVKQDESFACEYLQPIRITWNKIAGSDVYPGYVFCWKGLLYALIILAIYDWRKSQFHAVGFVQKQINRAAAERIPVQNFPHLYRSQQIKQKTDLNAYGGIKVIKTRAGKTIVHSPVGSIDAVFNKILGGYGWGFTMKQINEASHYSGGHANLRAAVDALQADALSRILMHVLKLADGIRSFEIIDVGAKFSKIGRVIQQAFTLDGNEAFRLNKEQDLVKQYSREAFEVIQGVHRQATLDWKATILRYSTAQDYMDAIHVFGSTPVVFVFNGVPMQKQLCQFCDVVSLEVVQAYSKMVGKVHYRPVRPRQTDYDVNYYLKELATYQQMRVDSRAAQLHAVWEGYIQDFNEFGNVEQSDRFYLLFDSHYYLQNWKPSPHGRVLLVGGDFGSQIGTYRLPLGEGEYRVFRENVTNQAKMRMVCSSSGTYYQHSLVHVEKAELRMDYGWYAHVMHDCSSRALRITPVVIPKMKLEEELQMEQTSHQANWMMNFITKCEENAKTVTKYSSMDKSFWFSSQAKRTPRVWCAYSEVSELKDYLEWNHDFGKKANVVIVKRVGGWFGALLAMLRIIPSHSISVSENRDTVTKKNLPTWLLGREKDLRQSQSTMVDGRRAQRYRFGYVQNAADVHLNGGLLTPEILKQCVEADIPKTRLKRQKFGTQPVEAEYKAMFFTKPCPPVPYVSDHLIRDTEQARQESRNTVDRVNRFIKAHPQDFEIKAGVGVDRVLEAKVIKTGYSFLEDVQEFQWSAKSALNAVYAMYHRHLACKLLPEARAIANFNQMTDRYLKWMTESVNEDLLQDPSWDPIQAIKEKSDFSRAKKILYYTQLLNALSKGKVTPGSFLTMVKSGQVNYSENLRVEGSFLFDQSSRPRNIMRPSESLCGVLTLLQNVLWKPLKKIEPGFIQGLTKDQLLTTMTKGVGDHWKVISLDGSSFDSTQNHQVMAAVDDKFWKMMQPGLLAVLEDLKSKSPNVFKAEPKQVLDGIMKQIMQQYNVCFTLLPGIEHHRWPDKIWSLWATSWGKQVAKGNDRDFVESNYIYNQINATTFSGHPTKTTLGNTIRSLCYAYYYLQQCGIKNPWKSDLVRVRAAGDDVVIFCVPHLEKLISNTILRCTSRGDDGQLGLGQRIKEVYSGGLQSIDFCSKWAFGAQISDLQLTRDIAKCLNTRQYYGKQNKEIVRHPGLHAQAIRQGFLSEKVSHLIQDILQLRVNLYGLPQSYNDQELRALSGKYKFSFSSTSKKGYQYENQVNARCGVSTSTMYRLMMSPFFVSTGFTANSGKTLFGYVKTSESGGDEPTTKSRETRKRSNVPASETNRWVNKSTFRCRTRRGDEGATKTNGSLSGRLRSVALQSSSVHQVSGSVSNSNARQQNSTRGSQPLCLRDTGNLSVPTGTSQLSESQDPE